MKIEGWQTKREAVSIEVNFWTIFNHVQTEAFKAAGIKYGDAYLDETGKQILFEDQLHTSHVYYEEVVLIEKPTAAQIEIVRRFQELRDLMRPLDL